jgi:hypothetical protein
MIVLSMVMGYYFPLVKAKISSVLILANFMEGIDLSNYAGEKLQ